MCGRVDCCFPLQHEAPKPLACDLASARGVAVWCRIVYDEFCYDVTVVSCILPLLWPALVCVVWLPFDSSLPVHMATITCGLVRYCRLYLLPALFHYVFFVLLH